jgi:hypothetical protein
VDKYQAIGMAFFSISVVGGFIMTVLIIAIIIKNKKRTTTRNQIQKRIVIFEKVKKVPDIFRGAG